MTGYIDKRSAVAMGLIPDENPLLKPFTLMELQGACACGRANRQKAPA